MDPNLVIDRLGGTGAVAKLCKIKPPSVTKWRSNGIPGYRMDFLRLACADVFSEIDAEDQPHETGPPQPST